MAITVETRTDIIELVVGMVGAAPGAAILGELAEIVDSGLSLNDLAIALANNPAFKVLYPSFLTSEEFATNYLTALIGAEVDATTLSTSIDAMVADLNAGTHRGAAMYSAITTLSATAEDDANFGAAAAALNNKTEVAVHYSVTTQQSADTLEELVAVVEDVTSDDATVTAGKGVVDGSTNPGTTQNLTIGSDSLVGLGGNDTFIANVSADGSGIANVETLTSLDTIDGGAGMDTLIYTTVGPTALPAASISNVETIRTISDLGVTADVSGATFSGVTRLEAKGVGAVALTSKSNVTSVSVEAGATTVAATDSGATNSADTLATVSVTGASGLVTIDSGAISAINLTNSNGGATVSSTGTGAHTYTLNNVTAGTITDANTKTLNVNASGVKSSGVTVSGAAATAVTFAADESLTVATLTAAAAKSITATGDSKVTISAGTLTALTSVDASASTGGLALTPAIGTATSFTGGAGKDSVTVTGATTKAIAMGDGDDTVTMDTAVTTGGSVDAGAGTDTLSLTSANAATLSSSAVFEAGISNFETVQIGNTGAADVVDLANLDDIGSATTLGVAAGGLTVNNMASGGTLTVAGVIAVASAFNVKGAIGGASDVLNIVALGAGGGTGLINTAATTVANVETINLVTADLSTTTNPISAGTILLTAAHATTVNISGNHGVDLTGSTLTAATTVDASGVVGTGLTSTAIGTAGAVTYTSTVTTAAVTIKGGNGTDTLTSAAGSTKVATIDGGAGNDTITGGAGADVLSGGEGADRIIGGLKGDTLSGGAGNDTFVMTSAEGVGTDTTLAASDVISDFSANTYGNGTAGAAGTGANAASTTWTGDVLEFDVAVALTKVDVSVQTNAADATVFIQNVSNATTDTVSAALDSTTGKLYVDLDSDGSVDSVLQLTGVTTITEAAFVLT